MSSAGEGRLGRTGGQPVPAEISRSAEPAGINLCWSDGRRQFIAAVDLRKNCPCASCRESRGEGNHNAPLSGKKPGKLFPVMQAGIEEQTEIVRIWAVGNYALGVLWGDKHDSGIYEFELLRELGKPAEA